MAKLYSFNDVYFVELATSIGIDIKPLHLLGNLKERFTANTMARASANMHRIYRRIVAACYGQLLVGVLILTVKLLS